MKFHMQPAPSQGKSRLRSSDLFQVLSTAHIHRVEVRAHTAGERFPVDSPVRLGPPPGECLDLGPPGGRSDPSQNQPRDAAAT